MHPQLANAINYSSIKKRFTVMKTQTTKKAIWLRSLILLPLLAITLYSFSSTQIIEKEITTETNPTTSQDEIIDYLRNQPKNIWINIMKDGSLNLNEIGRISLKSLEKNLEKLNSHLNLTLDEKKEKIDAIIQIDYDTDLKTLLKVKEILTAYGVKKITIKESVWENTNPDNPSRITEKYISETPSKIAKFKIGGEIMDVIDMPLDNLGTKKINGKTIYFITTDGKTSYWDEHRTPVDENGIEINNEKLQQKATKDQIAEYNKLAKKYNSMSKGNMVIKRSDLERIKYLYDLMSVEQRKKAQPFPSFPAPPPPAPDAPKTPEAPKLKEVWEVTPPPPLPENPSEAQKEKHKMAMKIYKQNIEKIANHGQIKKEELIKVRKISSAQDRELLKQEKLVYKEAQVAARTLKLKAQKEQLAKIQEVIDKESIASPQEKERIKKVTQAYAKKHSEKVTKTKLPSGEVIDIVEIPIDDEGIVDIYDKSYKYIIKDGEMTYYDKNGKTLTEEWSNTFSNRRIRQKSP
jgi:biopolymer transport protein ExbD